MYTIDFSKYARIFTFGCSYTSYAWDTWANLIGSQFPEKEFYNLGCPGAGNNYIANVFMQADEHYNFRSSDLVLICWSFPDREDRIFVSDKPNWHTVGSVYNNNIYDDNFLVRHANNMHYYMQTLSFIKLVENFFMNRGMDYFPFSTSSLVDSEYSHHRNNKEYRYNEQSMVAFSKLSARVMHYPSLHCVLWNNDHSVKEFTLADEYPGFTDTHPLPHEHATFLKTVFDYPWKATLDAQVAKSSDALKVAIGKASPGNFGSDITTYKSLTINSCIIR